MKMKLKFTCSMKKALKTFVLSSTWNKFLSGCFHFHKEFCSVFKNIKAYVDKH